MRPQQKSVSAPSWRSTSTFSLGTRPRNRFDLYSHIRALGKTTPLGCSVSGGNLPAVRFLLDHGADLHQQSEVGATVLHLASMQGLHFQAYSAILHHLAHHIRSAVETWSRRRGFMAKAMEPRIDASRESSSEDKAMKKEKEHKVLKGGLQLRSGSTMPASLRVGWHRETSRAGHGQRSARDGGVMWSTTSVFGRERAPGNKLKAASPPWLGGESGGQNERERWSPPSLLVGADEEEEEGAGRCCCCCWGLNGCWVRFRVSNHMCSSFLFTTSLSLVALVFHAGTRKKQ